MAHLALIPTGWSMLALITPWGAGWWWKQSLGGRQPSDQERFAYEQSLGLLQDPAPNPIRAPQALVRGRHSAAQRRRLRREPHAHEGPDRKRPSSGRARARARPPRKSRRQAHRRDQPAHPPGPKATKAPATPATQQTQAQPTVVIVQHQSSFPVELAIFLIKFMLALIGKAFQFANGGFALGSCDPSGASTGASAST